MKNKTFAYGGEGMTQRVYEYIPVESLEKMTEMLVYLLTGIDGTKKNGKI